MEQKTFKMKMYKSLILVIFFVFKMNAQQAEGQLRNRLDSFFGPMHENVFLHLNKSLFFKGERIWFQAYVYDQVNQKPSTSTFSLNVALYNLEGAEVDYKLIQIENGIGNGDFLIPRVSEESVYIIKAWTEGMALIDNNQHFSQLIHLIGQSSNPGWNIEAKKDRDLAISIYPEGGNTVSSIIATFGFHIGSNGPNNNSVSKIQLIDGEGQLVLDHIPVNPSGFGLVKFEPKTSRTYYLKVVLDNGKKILKSLPNPMETGMVLKLESISPSSFYLSINTDQGTLEKESGNVQFLMFQKNGKSLIQELVLDSTTTMVQLSKNYLFPGINSAILFDSRLRPVSERLVFNEQGLNLSNDLIKVGCSLNQSQDSVIIEISTENNTNDILHMSASLLPSESKAYNHTGTILSAFLVDPHVSRSIGQFIDWNKINSIQQLSQIDVQLLMEGPGKYPWEVIYKGHGALDTKFLTNNNDEIHISGRVQNADLKMERQLWFYSSLTAKSFFADLDDNKEFIVRAPVFKGDSLYVTLLGKNGNLRVPNLEVDISTNEQREMNWGPLTNQMMRFSLAQSNTEQFIIPKEPDAINLEEVILEGRRKLSSGAFLDIATHRITETERKRYGSLEIYLRRLGFRVIIENSRMIVTSYRHPFPRIPVFLNGFLTDGTELLGRPLNMVSSITYDSNNPTSIFITSNFEKESNGKSDYTVIPVESGYAIPLTFIVQNYSGLNQSLVDQVGAIHWQPNIVLESGKVFRWLFPRTEHRELKIYFEGFSKDGSLISFEKVLVVE